MSITRDPNALAAFVRHLGAEPIPGRTFRFEMPLGETRRIIPEINRLGLRCEKVSERQGSDINGRACSYATIELRHPPERTEYQDQRNLMAALFR